MAVKGENGFIHLFCWTLVLFVLCLCFTNSLDITERILLSRSLNVPSFSTIYGLSFSRCVMACDDHRKCSSVILRRIKKSCELSEHFPNQSIIVEDKGALVFAKETWSNMTYCTEGRCCFFLQKDGACGQVECTDRQTCDTQTNTCSYAECTRLEDTVSSHFSGNRLSTGSVAVKQCNTGFVFPDGGQKVQIVCNSTGNWESTDQSQEQVPDCIQTTCQTMHSRSSSPMEYDSFDEGSQRVVKIFCVYENDFGYTYISRQHVSYVTDASKFYSVNDHVMLRHARSDGTQWQGKLSILPDYRSRYNVTIGVNNYDKFADRKDRFGSENFILIGLVPLEYGNKKTQWHGYAFEEYEPNYKNCDFNNNNEIILSVNRENTQRTEVVCPKQNIVVACTWIDKASRTIYDLPESYFYNYTMFMGGCGVFLNYISLQDSKTVTGAAVGLGFELA